MMRVNALTHKINDTWRALNFGVRLALSRNRRKTISGLISRFTAGLGPWPSDSYQVFVWRHNTHVWVYRCTRVIVNAGMRVVPRQYREFVQNGIRKRELLPHDHPASKILYSPNHIDTCADIIEKILTSLCLTGNWYLYHNENAKELWHLRSDAITIKPDPKDYIKAFIYETAGKTTKILSPNEIVHGKFYNPDNEYYGLSPLRAATNSINAHIKAQSFNLNYFDNAAMPSSLISPKEGHWSNEDTKTIKKEWMELYGGYKKAGGTAVSSGAIDYKQLTHSHQEMEFIQLLDKARDEIFSAFGVPKIFANAKEAENYSNLKEYLRMLWLNTMIPIINATQQRLNKDLNQKYAEKGEYIRTIFDLSQVEELREDVVKEADAARIKITSGQMTINQAREARGEEPLSGGDISVMPMSMVRLNQVGDVLGNKIPPTGGGSPGKGKLIKSILPLKEQRFKHWLKTKEIILSNEMKMKRVLTAIFIDWGEEIKRNLDKYKNIKREFYVDDIMFDVEAGKEMLERAGGPILEDTIDKGGKRVIAQIATETAWEVTDPRVVELLSQAKQRFKEHIAEANWERVRDSLSEGINNGENVRQLTIRVDKTMGREINNAHTVARTEVLPRYHEGQVEGMRQSAVVEQKEWMAAFTENSRHEHIAADGQLADLDGFFEVGGEYLHYPGDPSGSASNIINCLCDLLPVIQAEE